MTADRPSGSFPLHGKTIVVTRPLEQAMEFSRMLEEEGASTLVYPAVEIVDTDDWSDCDAALASVDRYSAIVLTSANAADRFFRRAADQNVLNALQRMKTFVIGEKTRNTVHRYGVHTEEMPETASAEELAHVVVRNSNTNDRLVFPKGNLAGNELENILSANGITVDAVTVYRTQEPAFDETRRTMVRTIETSADMLTLFSPSGVAHLVRRAAPDFIRSVSTAVIGSTTAVAARRERMNVVVVSPYSALRPFVTAIREFYSSIKERAKNSEQ